MLFEACFFFLRRVVWGLQYLLNTVGEKMCRQILLNPALGKEIMQKDSKAKHTTNEPATKTRRKAKKLQKNRLFELETQVYTVFELNISNCFSIVRQLMCPINILIFA